MSLDIEFIKSQLPLFKDAAILTIEIASIGIILSIIIGIINNAIYLLNIRPLSKLIHGYVEVSRNTPFLIQLFFLYFALPSIGIKLSSFVTAILGLSFLGGSYMTETFRSGIEAVPKSQIESALSVGLSKWQILRFIILPQAINICIPSLINNFIFLLKETSVVSAIAVPELLHTTTSLISLYYKTYEMLVTLTVFYLILFLPVSFFLSFIERRMKYGQYGA
ncbi:putative glutamine ABC transporter permease protein GlnM [Gottschalkia purinilytica]|uniref:Putative glutamine ABC transporter permease protein GlnM n=1 Tax=Gottschalkia purinilytica TaxID=1503 RepID=A0A0L0W973_GOTPU|nr:amino acid ABC transporter permease [Gottschalkia purinilytica]KNF08108.1 putative glutamine ABC transporter permease protein GlnM [Gottschalkia purinilytica]